MTATSHGLSWQLVVGEVEFKAPRRSTEWSHLLSYQLSRGTFARTTSTTFTQPFNMSLKLKPPTSTTPLQPFSWDNLPTSPGASSASDVPQSPPTTWLNSKDDMKMFGAEPLREEVGIVKCRDCDKPVLKCAIMEHIGVQYIARMLRCCRLTMVNSV
jgi:hypothetical protein